MTQALFLRPEAERDIADAASWYEIRRAGLGRRFLGELDHLFTRILVGPQHFPEIGEDVRRGLLRRFPYAVYFIDRGQSLTVLAVLHLRRHPETWKGHKRRK